MNWFLHDRDLRHERDKDERQFIIFHQISCLCRQSIQPKLAFLRRGHFLDRYIKEVGH